MVLKTSSSHEEGCERNWSVTTKAFLGDENGNLRAVKVANLEWKFTEEGRYYKVYEPV
jgi:glutamate synthase (NADPH/NADH) small chain